MSDDLPPPDVAGAGAAAAALIAADGEFRRGVVEQPPGSNRGPDVDVYLGADLAHFRLATPCAADGWQGASWCGRFARWCFVSSGVSSLDGWGDLASWWKWEHQAMLRGVWRRTPAPGLVGVISPPPGATHGHLVLVATVDQALRRVSTREGNEGDAVAARWRPIPDFAGFVDVVAGD